MLADLVVAAHLVYIAFVVFGGLLVLRWRKVAWLHVPAVAWAVVNELGGLYCPLTPLEFDLREGSGTALPDSARASFVERYVLPVIYPAELTREIQVALGACVLALNLAVYLSAVRRRRRATRRGPPR